MWWQCVPYLSNAGKMCGISNSASVRYFLTVFIGLRWCETDPYSYLEPRFRIFSPQRCCWEQEGGQGRVWLLTLTVKTVLSSTWRCPPCPGSGSSSDLRGKLRNPGPLQASSAFGLTLIWVLIPGKEANLLIALSMSGFYMFYPVYSL